MTYNMILCSLLHPVLWGLVVYVGTGDCELVSIDSGVNTWSGNGLVVSERFVCT